MKSLFLLLSVSALLFDSTSADQKVFVPRYTDQLLNSAESILDGVSGKFGKSLKDWRTRSIYQVLVDRYAKTDVEMQSCTKLDFYCGGTFKGLIKNLDHIVDMGFNAIWISPVIENTYGGYHGYYAKDFYKINPHFGTEADLRKLVKECHERDVWVMLDVVANHVGNVKNAEDFKKIQPFNDAKYYHGYCIIKNYEIQHQVEQCRIGDERSSLPDLNTEDPFVVNQLNKWVSWIVKEFDFDGIRIDTVKHVRKEFWPGFVKSAGVFSIGEVLHGDPKYVGPYQYFMDSMLNFPMYFTINDVFKSKQSMWKLEERWEQNNVHFRETTVLGNFVDNHDYPRFLNNFNDPAILRNALAFILFAEGIPIVYQGTEFLFNGGADPLNRESNWPAIHRKQPHLYSFFRTLNKLRQLAGNDFFKKRHQPIWTNDDLHVFQRENVIVVMTNKGQGSHFTRQILVNDKFDYINVLDPYANDYLQFKDARNWKQVVEVTIRNGEPKVYYPASLIKKANLWDFFFGL